MTQPVASQILAETVTFTFPRRRCTTTEPLASLYLVKHFGLPVQNELANATIDSFYPSRPASATIPYDTLQLAARATLHHDYHSDSTAMIAAAASSPSLARAPNYESADGIAYWGLTAPASLSMAVSGSWHNY